MFLARLHLRNFRNFAEQLLELPPQGAAIVGDNGQGKTNLLEAIYYLEIFRSFRGAADEQLVRFGEEVFRIEGRVVEVNGAEREIAAAFDRRGRRKKVTVGGAEPPRLGDAIGGIAAIIFSPSDVGIVSGAPGARRRFLDIVLSLAVPGYLGALQRYRQVLGHRNALLRQGAPYAQVAAWNEGLVSWGSRVVAARAEWVAARRASFSAHSAGIAGGAAGLLEYEASVGPDQEMEGIGAGLSTAPIETAFAEGLVRLAEREQRRGMTVLGPHRDDLRIAVEGEAPGAWLDLRAYGSGGQQRTAAIALRMVEAETIRETRHRAPIILLDDVFAELDPGRSRRLLEWVEREEVGQVILTAPKPGDFELRSGSLLHLRIAGGRLSPV
ncbi:MAG TPA: DNA replication and repair protein RecF [Longimicrobiaceae bacterium]|nr:DNA replication and repair protein RecF [Longimicrobiaceae bacterium]